MVQIYPLKRGHPSDQGHQLASPHLESADSRAQDWVPQDTSWKKPSCGLWAGKGMEELSAEQVEWQGERSNGITHVIVNRAQNIYHT